MILIITKLCIFKDCNNLVFKSGKLSPNNISWPDINNIAASDFRHSQRRGGSRKITTMASSSSSSSPKRCLYEVLNLPRDSSPDEIRSAYKKLALQRHPDKLIKSGVSESEATASFQELVNAYEVLSDPKERAWYDSHRNQILFSSSVSNSNNSNSSGGFSSGFVPDLFPFFSSSVYSGYSDKGKGFYKVYGDLFDKIYAGEFNFAKKLGLPLPKEAPLMGNLDSPYVQVCLWYPF